MANPTRARALAARSTLRPYSRPRTQALPPWFGGFGFGLGLTGHSSAAGTEPVIVTEFDRIDQSADRIGIAGPGKIRRPLGGFFNWSYCVALSGFSARCRSARPCSRNGASSLVHSGAQHRDGVALLVNFRMQRSTRSVRAVGFHLDPVDIGRCEHQHAHHEEMEDAHGQPPLITSARPGHAGNAAASCVGAAVRSATRSFAERARGLAAISSAPGVTGRLVKRLKLGTAWASSADAADPPPALARSVRKFLTMRSSSE